MFLGHDQSDPNNVHQKVSKLGILLVHYPPPEKVARYKALTENIPPESAVTMFVGQIPNMMPLHYLAWSIDTICGGYVIESLKHARKSGCAVAYVRVDAVDVVLAKSRSILFDVHGLWRPTTAEQLEKLHGYCAELRSGEFPEVHADGRVPKGCIVFEEMGKPKLTNQAAPDLGHLQIRDKRSKGATHFQYHPSSAWPDSSHAADSTTVLWNKARQQMVPVAQKQQQMPHAGSGYNDYMGLGASNYAPTFVVPQQPPQHQQQQFAPHVRVPVAPPAVL